MGFLPITRAEAEERGWDEVDFVLVTGDAYVDHPSFGSAIISRVLEDNGYKVAIVPQPYYKDDRDISAFGRPRIAFLVNAGNLDSMVAHYTVARKKRSDDAYTPGGKAGKRPDRAVTVYSRLIRRYYPDVPIVIGGVEASLRRFAHYDYWSDTVMPSVLVDSGADILIYGMGERQIAQVAEALEIGGVDAALGIKGICYISDKPIISPDTVILPSFEDVRASKKNYAMACRTEYDEQDYIRGKRLVQKHGAVYVVQNRNMEPLTTEEMDHTYELPYERYYHPSYEAAGGVPAIREVEFSITHNRGCFGACNFCAIAYHQGRVISTRSKESVIREAIKLTESPHFKGYIHDVGGPTANFRCLSCKEQETKGMCKGRKCLAPTPCRNLQVTHTEYLDILRELRGLPKVKRVFIRSGIRFDYLIEDRDDEFFQELVKYHVSGQLKVAPEHCSDAVLDKMGKPHIAVYKRFMKKFYELTGQAGKEQYLVPYLMSSHPGSTIKDAVELAVFLKKEKVRPEQVQDFYPTPGTISTCMYYTGLDPYTMEPVYTPHDSEDKAMQRALLQWFKPENRALVEKALRKAGRTDLIGTSPDCLIRPLNGGYGSGNRQNGRGAGASGGRQRSGNGSAIGKGGKTGKGNNGTGRGGSGRNKSAVKKGNGDKRVVAKGRWDPKSGR